MASPLFKNKGLSLSSFNAMKNAQTSIEFIVLVGFILFFFTIYLFAVQGNISDKLKEKQNQAVREIAIIILDEIKLASESGDGYYREFEIPGDIYGKDYDATIIESMIYVKTKDNKYAVALPVPKTSGQVIKGRNIIRKENGEVKLNV